jgi:hypothetical protein
MRSHFNSATLNVALTWFICWLFYIYQFYTSPAWRISLGNNIQMICIRFIRQLLWVVINVLIFGESRWDYCGASFRQSEHKRAVQSTNSWSWEKTDSGIFILMVHAFEIDIRCVRRQLAKIIRRKNCAKKDNERVFETNSKQSTSSLLFCMLTFLTDPLEFFYSEIFLQHLTGY